MKSHSVVMLLALSAPLVANEALDILEGKKDAASVTVPPLPEDASVLSGALGTTDASGKSTKPYKVMVPSEFSVKSHEMFDPIWERALLYQNEKNPYVQEFSLTGLFEGAGAWGSIDNDLATSTLNQNVNDVQMRRAQLGARMKAFYRTEVTGVVEMAGPSRMNGIQTLKARTEMTENTGVTVGKFRPLSTQENNTLDANLLISERSLLSNMVAPADSLGVMFDATAKGWTYQIGWFSGDFSDNLPGIKNDGLVNAGISYEKVGKAESGAPLRTRWYLNYLHSLDHDGSEVLPRHRYSGASAYSDLYSTGFSLQQDRFGFMGDFTIARGDNNAWGLTLMPTYWIMPSTIQLVARYHYADSDKQDAIYGGYGPGADPFYQGDGPIVSGDEYHSFYMGANVHLYENRMIISNGLEYSLFRDDLDSETDTTSLMWQTGAKLSF
jgi:hypothetical protein